MHMVASRLGCKRAMVGTRWANSYPSYMNRLRKSCSHLVGASFLEGKGTLTLSGRYPTDNADYCMLVNECYGAFKACIC